jgi:hypothetical protein
MLLGLVPDRELGSLSGAAERRPRSCPIALDISLWQQMKELWGVKKATLQGRHKRRAEAPAAAGGGDGAVAAAGASGEENDSEGRRKRARVG